MASAEAVAVSDEATALHEASALPVHLVLATEDVVYLGGEDVDSDAGFALPTTGPLQVTVLPGDVLYAVTETTATVNVLRT